MLRIIAKRLQNAIRANDLPARLGGDKFAVLLRDPVSVEIAETISQRIIAANSEPLGLDRWEITSRASIGIFKAKGPKLTRNEIMQGSDKALYQGNASSVSRPRLPGFFRPSVSHPRRAMFSAAL